MSTVSRDTLLGYLSDYLNVPAFRDYGPQGLQVEGNAEVRKVVTGVSGSVALFEAAAAAGADMVLVHHGIFWDRDSRVVKGGLKRRLELLLEHGITLAGYHLCLDAHPELGNNILAAKGLGLEKIEPWNDDNGQGLGFRGEWSTGKSPEAALAAINALYGSNSLAFLYGPNPVRSVGIISGGAQGYLKNAIELGLDLFVTGEASEYCMNQALEGGIHFVGAGHYNTERLGIRALGEHLTEKFGVEHEFVDLPNPV
jgi:dinuclear metal center YbgI/SA1388 family protein